MVDFVEYVKELSKDNKRLDDLLKAAMREAGYTEVVLEDGMVQPL